MLQRIRISQQTASFWLEMLEHAVISAAATVYELKSTKQTRATMHYSANTLKMIKEKQTLLHEMRKAGSSSSPSCLRWQQKAISKAVRAEKRDRIEKLLMRADEAKGAGATRIIYRTINSLARKGEPASEKQKNSTHEPRLFSPSWPQKSRSKRTQAQRRTREHDRPRRSPRTSLTRSKCTSS